MDFLNFWKHAKLVLTDSGGPQQETTASGGPCLARRHDTERPIGVDQRNSVSVGTEPGVILREAQTSLDGSGNAGKRPALWTARAAERTVQQLGGLL